jgi:hypothetical protein
MARQKRSVGAAATRVWDLPCHLRGGRREGWVTLLKAPSSDRAYPGESFLKMNPEDLSEEALVVSPVTSDDEEVA